MTRFVFIAALALAALMTPPAMAESEAKLPAPGTSFQTGGPWVARQDIRSDAAIVYSADKATMDSWANRGYTVQTMGGFRTGDAYIKEHPEEGQTNSAGIILTCGPGSYYMVPTERRVQAMVDFFLQAIANGSRAVIPEEPEYFASAGYSASFKDAWQKEYGEPWQDPASSFDTRIRAERLKGKMELNLIRTILQAAEKKDPSVRRMVAHHSPVNYHGWGITFPFDDFAKMTELQEVIGQVWTGTARTPAMFRGKVEERTFETALLEYSSLVELYRGTGKRLWFLADPLEDNLSRTMEDFRENYSHTVVASLLFPQVNAFELLPWPDRIYGRVPAEYATALGCVFNALEEVSRLPASDAAGSDLGVLIGDSAAYQRAAPAPNDLTGFFGLTLPLMYEGLRVRVAPIERVVEPDYLRSFKVLVLSYDFFKPMKSEYNTAIANWVREGGQLILAGGENEYNGAQQWWRAARFGSPDQHLLLQLGLDARVSPPDTAARDALEFKPLWKETARVSSMSNRREIEAPLEPGSAGTLVRFRDSFRDDGWGPLVTRIDVWNRGLHVRIGTGTDKEKQYLRDDRGSRTNADGRFADGDSSFCYLFEADQDVSKITFTVGNQAEVDYAVLDKKQFSALSGQSSVAGGPLVYRVTSGKVSPVKRSLTSDKLVVRSEGFRAAAGKGAVEYLGLPAESFARDAGGLIVQAVEDAFKRAKAKPLRDKLHVVERGPYVAAHLEPSAEAPDRRALPGQMVDLLDARLPVLNNPAVEGGTSRLFRKVEQSGQPCVLAASYETRVDRQDEDGMTLANKGPLETPGAVRLYAGDRVLREVTAVDSAGKPVAVSHEVEGQTVYVTFPGSPEGVTLNINWRRRWSE